MTGRHRCKRCGHGSVGKHSHGRLGCVQCGTAKSMGGHGGCKSRDPGPCPCPFHRNHDEVILARTCSSLEMLPPASAVQRLWRTYEGSSLPQTSIEWSRINSEAVAKLLSMQCGCPRNDTYRYLLPAMLHWDIMHPNDDGIVFKAVAVSGECVVGVTGSERQEPCKKLAVLEWCALTKANVSADLLRVFNELPRAKRSVEKRIALQFCPALVEAYCRTEFIKMIGRGHKARDELEELARAFYCEDWGFQHLSALVRSDLDRIASDMGQGPKKKQRHLLSFFKIRQR